MGRHLWSAQSGSSRVDGSSDPTIDVAERGREAEALLMGVEIARVRYVTRSLVFQVSLRKT